MEEFERFTVPILDRVLDERAGGQERIFIFDEIGKMELLSPDFISRIRRLLESKDPKLHVLGTVAIAGALVELESQLTEPPAIHETSRNTTRTI